MEQSSKGGLPFNSFIGNVSLEFLVERLKAFHLISLRNLQGCKIIFQINWCKLDKKTKFDNKIRIQIRRQDMATIYGGNVETKFDLY